MRLVIAIITILLVTISFCYCLNSPELCQINDNCDMDSSEVSETTLKSLSVKELKNLLKLRGVDHADCVEKSDLIRLVLETKDQHQSGDSTIIGSIRERHSTLVGLDCITVSRTTKPKYIVIFR
jgi:hypothetical protein